MLKCVATPAVITLILLGCRPALSEKERMILGTWDRTGLDFSERTTYRADHSLESTFDGSAFAKGTWRLEGDTLVEEVTPAMAAHPQ
jgi:hypothetical protein